MDLFRKKSVDQLVAESTPLKRTMRTFDLTMLGIGAIIGTGTLVATPQAKQPFEIQAEEIFIEGASTPDYPLRACAMRSSPRWHQCPVPHIRTRIWRSAS